MARYPDSFITEVSQRNSIEDVVGEYVDLTKTSGSHKFGLCPFHSEKTPSFSVLPSKQMFYCFGCGKGGDVITFVRDIEGLTYPEALEKLAKRAGIPIPELGNSEETKRRDRMYSLNRDAARFYHNNLLGPSGGPAREYIAKRRLSPAIVTRFGLGYASGGFHLQNAMKALGYSEKEMLEADLIRPGKGGTFYDTFRSRLLFPVIDTAGRVIAFSGRIIGDGEPKYLNSRDTAVFSKGSNLFGLNLAKKSKAGYIILVEGNVDVVSLHQAGFDSAVASLGTSFTDEQARLISRYTTEVVLAYDSDGAGLKAAGRGIGILEKLNVKVRVLRWDGAKDPDDFIKLKGAGAFRNLIEKSEGQIDYRLLNIRNKYDLSVPEQKVDYLREAINLIAALPGDVVRDVYAGRVAEIAGVGKDAVVQEVSDKRDKLFSSGRKKIERESLPENIRQPADRELRYTNLKSAMGEEGIIRLLFLEPSLISNLQGRISPDDFTSEALRHIFEVISERIISGRDVSPALLAADMSSAEMSLLSAITGKPEVLACAAGTLNDYITAVKENNGHNGGSEHDLRAIAANNRENKGKGYIQK